MKEYKFDYSIGYAVSQVQPIAFMLSNTQSLLEPVGVLPSASLGVRILLIVSRIFTGAYGSECKGFELKEPVSSFMHLLCYTGKS